VIPTPGRNGFFYLFSGMAFFRFTLIKPDFSRKKDKFFKNFNFFSKPAGWGDDKRIYRRGHRERMGCYIALFITTPFRIFSEPLVSKNSEQKGCDD
jgi:hypothetical protein